MLRELYREPAPGRAVETGEKALDDPLGDQLDPAEPRNFAGVEKVEAFAADGRGGAHETQKLMTIDN